MLAQPDPVRNFYDARRMSATKRGAPGSVVWYLGLGVAFSREAPCPRERKASAFSADPHKITFSCYERSPLLSFLQLPGPMNQQPKPAIPARMQ